MLESFKESKKSRFSSPGTPKIYSTPSFQIIDIVRMMEPLTKSSKQIVNGSMIPSLVRDAFRLAEEERPGAVHLELPEDVAFEEVKDWHIFPAPSYAQYQ
jgi:thiamine pyrophosphate-dependent acetolactate synthase large subunit-like protein